MAFSLLSLSAAALTPATLLTPELEAQRINLAGLDGGTISFFDDQRRLTRASVEGYVRLSLEDQGARHTGTEVPEPQGNTVEEGKANSGGGWIELVDGQRFAGRWGGSARGGEGIVWHHPTLGRFTFGLDDVRRVALQSASASDVEVFGDPGTAEGDTVAMRNGDTVTGFVVSVGEQTVTVLPDGADAEVALPLGGVVRVALANPALRHGGGVAGDLVVMHDGSRVRGGGVRIAGESMTFTPTLSDAMRPVTVEVAAVRRIDFAAAGWRVVALADQPMEVVAGGEAFGLTWPVEVRGGDLHLHAPVTLRVDLPDGAQRFAATAALDLPAGLAESRAAWADLSLWIGGAAGSEPSTAADERRFPLRYAEPEQTINLPLRYDEPTLTLRVDPASHGPVLDRLRLRDAILLVEVPEPRPGTGDVER